MQLVQKRLYFQKINLVIIQLLIKNFIINLKYFRKYACINFLRCSYSLQLLRKHGKGENFMENLVIVELTQGQEKTIKQAFKTEHLKDELAIDRMFDYDFNFDDD